LLINIVLHEVRPRVKLIVMANRKTKFFIGEYYHIYNRGVEKRDIFNDNNDCDRFLKLLFLCNSRKSVHIVDMFRKNLSLYDILEFNRGDTLVDIIAYCLMPNHFHLVIKERIEGGISKFIQKLSTGYTMYFNERNDRSGALFQGAFKSEHINNDAYFNYIFVYICLNPLSIIEPGFKNKGISDKERAKSFIKKYKYSSYIDYVGTGRKESVLINKDCVPNFLKDMRHFDEFIDGLEAYTRSDLV